MNLRLQNYSKSLLIYETSGKSIARLYDSPAYEKTPPPMGEFVTGRVDRSWACQKLILVMDL